MKKIASMALMTLFAFAMFFGIGGVNVDIHNGVKVGGDAAYAATVTCIDGAAGVFKGTNGVCYDNQAEASASSGSGSTDCKVSAADQGKWTTGCKNDDINNRIMGVAKLISGLVAAIAVVMVAYAGFKYATSQGDTKVTEQAKMQIITAGIGVFIAGGAFVILSVFQNLFK